ncbi:hypothetical protein HK096_000491 [Nowakowskiella sp. JEL0078]|nr:hypothetical protein HK096_000491 [Nowakowskiella sp. JEL0078]
MLNVSKELGHKEKVNPNSFEKISRKKVLSSIERVYAMVLSLEQLNRDGPKDEEADEWKIEIEEKIHQLWIDLRIAENIAYGAPHPFAAFLSIAKGKKVIPRIIRFLSADQILLLVTTIFARLDGLDVCQEQVSEAEMELFMNNVIPPVVGFISEVPLNIVNACMRILLERHNVLWLAHTKIGLVFLTLFLSRAEILKQSMGGGQQELEVQAWTELYGFLFTRLMGNFGGIFGSFEVAATVTEGELGDVVYVWQFLAAVAVGATTMEHQRVLVTEVREKIIETSKRNENPKALANVNLFLNALGLGIDAAQLAALQ